MRGKWFRWGLAVGLVVAMGNLCGCGMLLMQPSTVDWTDGTEPTKAPAIFVEFPHTLTDSALVIEEVVRYQGRFWEDGSGEMVEGVAGIMLYNPTARMVEFEAIALEQEGETLYFFAYQLPPMSRCLVLERNKNAPIQVTACRELSTQWYHHELSREQVDYVGLGPTLTLVNRDSRQQDHITVRYKQYVKEGDYYLGGVAYSAHLFCLQPEERRTVTPEHYYAGKAKIVSIVVNE